ncbi:MAG: dTDP-4-dehydrorhamnose reductase [Thermoanaerobaculia bacterium]|nr:dTDP-4-dehydrorhamnose reductase [Thermoanaerobaculia bacterium]
MRTLVFGGTGIVGGALVSEGRRRGWPVLGLSHAQGDISDPRRVADACAAFRPALIVNCAAFTKVDLCETERASAFAVNGTAVGHLVRAAEASGARLVHLSTDYVFDGRATSPYTEEHPTAPQSVYGASKLEGERQALASERSLVVRTSWIFGARGANFVDTIAGRIRNGQKSFRVVEDQVGAPTWAPFLARAVSDLGEWGITGLVHYQNRPAVSWYGLAREIARRLDPAVEVVPIPTSEAPRPAPRPAFSVLAVDRFEQLAGRNVESWQDGLAKHLGS